MSGAVTGSRREPAQDSLVNRGPDQIRKGCGNMGRISKRGGSVAVAFGENKGVAAGGKKRYKAGIYARLSADADARKNESIGIQEEISRKYVEEMNRNNREIIDIIGCYRDLGKTGSNFNREGFLRLMQDIRQGNIDWESKGRVTAAQESRGLCGRSSALRLQGSLGRKNQETYS